MSHESEFAQMAWSETTTHESDVFLAGVEVRGMLSGHIGQLADTKEEYLAEGLRWLDDFKSSVADARERIAERNADCVAEESDEDDNEDEGENHLTKDQIVEGEFKYLLSVLGEVDRKVFSEILAEDWDERHEDEENDDES